MIVPWKRNTFVHLVIFFRSFGAWLHFIEWNRACRLTARRWWRSRPGFRRPFAVILRSFRIFRRWSRNRKRYEHQGILVETAAIEKAEAECLADTDQRRRGAGRRAREAELHQVKTSRWLGIEESKRDAAHNDERQSPLCSTLLLRGACMRTNSGSWSEPWQTIVLRRSATLPSSGMHRPEKRS